MEEKAAASDRKTRWPGEPLLLELWRPARGVVGSQPPFLGPLAVSSPRGDGHPLPVGREKPYHSTS